MSERQGDTGVKGNVSRHQPLGVGSIGSRCRSSDGSELKLAGERVIESVSQACRAVVPIVVVPIKLVLRQGVGMHELLELQTLPGCEVELLRQYRSIHLLVKAKHGLEVDSLHPVSRVTGEESCDKVRLVEVEHSPVVGHVGSAGLILYPDGVVSEALPDCIAPTEGEQVDREVRAGFGGSRYRCRDKRRILRHRLRVEARWQADQSRTRQES